MKNISLSVQKQKITRLIIVFILHLIPFLIFFCHIYKVSFIFEPGTAPRESKLYYAKKYFTESKSSKIYGNSVVVSAVEAIKYVRLDIDVPNSAVNYSDLKAIQINGIKLSGEQLTGAITNANYMTAKPAGGACRLLLNPPDTPHPAPGCFPDYHIVFKIKSKLYFCDYSYFALAIKIFIFCVLQAVIVYSAKKTAGMNFEQKIKVVDIIIGILLFGSTIYYCYFF